MKKVLEVQDIKNILPHRYPFLMVDRIIELEKRKHAVGIKNVSVNEYYFMGHYPQKPLMPGVLMIEAMAQVGGVMMLYDSDSENVVPYLAAVEKVRFRRTVVPGDQLIIETDIIKSKGGVGRVKGVCKVEGEIACEGEIVFVLRKDNSTQ